MTTGQGLPPGGVCVAVESVVDLGTLPAVQLAQAHIMTSSSSPYVAGSCRYKRTGSAALLAGGGIGSAMTNLVGSAATATGSPTEAPPLPGRWVRLDPLQAGRPAHYFYKEKGGCGTASCLSLLSLLRVKVGYPWTTTGPSARSTPLSCLVTTGICGGSAVHLFPSDLTIHSRSFKQKAGRLPRTRARPDDDCGLTQPNAVITPSVLPLRACRVGKLVESAPGTCLQQAKAR